MQKNRLRMLDEHYLMRCNARLSLRAGCATREIAPADHLTAHIIRGTHRARLTPRPHQLLGRRDKCQGIDRAPQR